MEKKLLEVRDKIRRFRKACDAQPDMIEELYEEIYTDLRPGKDKYKRIKVDGVQYESVIEACEAMGWNRLSLGCSKCLYAKQEGDVEWLFFKGHYVEYPIKKTAKPHTYPS